ncbi:uncharacterized protein LOC136028141 [Artemia franciscana]|uniref:uncharacterized protein LOC136028141 n=1 Tax=Artemia franciscana TaxID=6661 RepID=UPI0032D9E784
MEWTNDLMLSFISEYGKYPLLWDNTHPFYKSVPKKNEAWDAISEELGIEVPDLKRKMTSLLATYRKLRHKLAMTKSGSGADVDTAPVWFAYKAFAFLHNKYHPKTKVNIEGGLGISIDERNDIDEYSDEADSLLAGSQEAIDGADAEDNVIMTHPLMKRKREVISVKESPYNKCTKNEHCSMEERYTVLRTGVQKNRDDLESYGEYIVNTLRSMDKITRAYVKKEIAEIIFKAETGSYGSHLLMPLSLDYSRPNSRNSVSSAVAPMPYVQSSSSTQSSAIRKDIVDGGHKSQFGTKGAHSFDVLKDEKDNDSCSYM